MIEKSSASWENYLGKTKKDIEKMYANGEITKAEYEACMKSFARAEENDQQAC